MKENYIASSKIKTTYHKAQERLSNKLMFSKSCWKTCQTKECNHEADIVCCMLFLLGKGEK